MLLLSRPRPTSNGVTIMQYCVLLITLDPSDTVQLTSKKGIRNFRFEYSKFTKQRDNGYTGKRRACLDRVK